MAEVSIIHAAVGIVEMDASVSESHSLKAEITRHPVEGEADMSDHIHDMPDMLTLRSVITNHPLRFISGNTKTPKSPLTTDNVPVDDRNETALAQLIEYKSNGARLDVVTALRTYSNMSIAVIGINRDAASGNILDLTIDLEEVPISETQQVSLPKPKKKAVKKKKNTGKTGKENATEKQKSQMKKIKDKVITGFFA